MRSLTAYLATFINLSSFYMFVYIYVSLLFSYLTFCVYTLESVSTDHAGFVKVEEEEEELWFNTMGECIRVSRCNYAVTNE